LGAIWRTGPAAYDADVRAWLGLSARAHLLGFVYLGYPAMDPPRRERTPATLHSLWLGWGPDELESEAIARHEETGREDIRV